MNQNVIFNLLRTLRIPLNAGALPEAEDKIFKRVEEIGNLHEAVATLNSFYDVDFSKSGRGFRPMLLGVAPKALNVLVVNEKEGLVIVQFHLREYSQLITLHLKEVGVGKQLIGEWKITNIFIDISRWHSDGKRTGTFSSTNVLMFGCAESSGPVFNKEYTLVEENYATLSRFLAVLGSCPFITKYSTQDCEDLAEGLKALQINPKKEEKQPPMQHPMTFLLATQFALAFSPREEPFTEEEKAQLNASIGLPMDEAHELVQKIVGSFDIFFNLERPRWGQSGLGFRYLLPGTKKSYVEVAMRETSEMVDIAQMCIFESHSTLGQMVIGQGHKHANPKAGSLAVALTDQGLMISASKGEFYDKVREKVQSVLATALNPHPANGAPFTQASKNGLSLLAMASATLPSI